MVARICTNRTNGIANYYEYYDSLSVIYVVLWCCLFDRIRLVSNEVKCRRILFWRWKCWTRTAPFDDLTDDVLLTRSNLSYDGSRGINDCCWFLPRRCGRCNALCDTESTVVSMAKMWPFAATVSSYDGIKAVVALDPVRSQNMLNRVRLWLIYWLKRVVYTWTEFWARVKWDVPRI